MQINDVMTGPASQPSSSSALTSDFTTFLRMLTVQMQNQDPLNPMEATDFSVQLATFSGVEQQVQTNQLLQSLAGQFTLIGMAQLAGWVGQEARVAVSSLWFSGSPVTLSPEPDPTADRVILAVYDAKGQLASREEMPLGNKSYQWLGGDFAGQKLPSGSYSLKVESWRNDLLIKETPVAYYAKVTEARANSSGPVLLLQGGTEVPASAVTGLRHAGN